MTYAVEPLTVYQIRITISDKCSTQYIGLCPGDEYAEVSVQPRNECTFQRHRYPPAVTHLSPLPKAPDYPESAVLNDCNPLVSPRRPSVSGSENIERHWDFHFIDLMRPYVMLCYSKSLGHISRSSLTLLHSPSCSGLWWYWSIHLALRSGVKCVI